MGRVIQRAEDLGEEELADVLAAFKTNIARRAALQRECEQIRARIKRRYRYRDQATFLSKERRKLARPKLYLVDATPFEE